MTIEPTLIPDYIHLLYSGMSHALGQIARFPRESGDESNGATYNAAGDSLGDAAATPGQAIAQESSDGSYCSQAQRGTG
jgi:hypothetical protein